ncbi:MAG: LytTR family DNA-binding domain-containing protein [Bacteroidales bacterium]|nr:LytTR family DNA-binding domain-containing protein [Bacteroidales bacterium]
MIRAVIVEDDLMHVKTLVEMISTHIRDVEILSVCTNVPEAVKQIEALKPQLVFLDIELGPYTGFDLLDMVSKRDFEVIFTTAYQKYALRAIKISALDYIEKPFDVEDLKEALSRYQTRASEKKIQNLLNNFKISIQDHKIAFYDKGTFLFVKLKDILRLHSDNAYTEVYYNDNQLVNKLVVSKGIAHFEDFFEGRGLFFRVHNQHLININHIKQLGNDNGFYIVMDDAEKSVVPVARARRDEFLLFLRQSGILI